MEIDYATSNITNTCDLKEKIHEIHNFMRNNGIGYGLTSLKVFNLFYGLMKIEDYGLNKVIGLNDEKCKFSYLLKKSKEKGFENILNELLDIIYEKDDDNNNNNIKILLYCALPLDLREDVYNEILNKIKSIKDIEKSSKEQLSGKIYEYFVGRDQSAISELGAYFTNRRIVNFCLDKVKPQIKSDGSIPKMIDMFGGSGGFTIGYMDYLNKNFTIDWKQQLDNIYHFDINQDVLNTAILEYFCLSGGNIPKFGINCNIDRTNSFKKNFEKYGKFDLILTNPPYGGDKVGTSGKKEKRDKIIEYINNEIKLFKNKVIEILEGFKDYKKILDDIKKPNIKIDKILKLINDIDYFKDNHDVKRIQQLYEQSNELKKENKIEIEDTKKLCVNVESSSEDIRRFAAKHKLKGTDKEACSLMLIMDLLAMDGTAVGVLKEGLFFDSSYTDLRKVLIENFNVKEIISVPSNQFENTATKTSIVIFKNEEEKTSMINFSELKVNLYDNDEFIEKNNRIYLKFNKGDIKNVEEIFIKSVSVNEIKSNETYSLNSKDYNKVSIECGDNFKLVRIGDICEFEKYKSQKEDINSIYNYYSCSNIIKKCNNPNLNGEYILLGTRGTIIEALHYINGKFGCNNNMLIFKSKNIKNIYIYYIINVIKILINNYINGSTIPMISKEKFQELEIPIPKTQELIDYWVDKISTPFNLKQEKEKRFKEIENEIKSKIKDIQDNYECDEVRLGDICNINPKNITIYDNYINYVDIGSIVNNNIETITKLFKPYPSRAKRNILKGDIIYSSVRPNLKGYTYIKQNIYNGIASTGFILIRTVNINYLYIYHSLIFNNLTDYLVKNSSGSSYPSVNADIFKDFKIKLPKDKTLIDNLQPLFDEVEVLQKEIKELDETYNEYLQELSKSAIKNQEILNSNNDNYEETEEISNETHDIDDEPITVNSETSSKKSLTIAELKEQCKSLGIKGYSKKNKEELIEMIKNHK
jgi:type I restriction-modification system DNA methylase subunit